MKPVQRLPPVLGDCVCLGLQCLKTSGGPKQRWTPGGLSTAYGPWGERRLPRGEEFHSVHSYLGMWTESGSWATVKVLSATAHCHQLCVMLFVQLGQPVTGFIVIDQMSTADPAVERVALWVVSRMLSTSSKEIETP